MDESLIHLDGLQELAERAANAHAVGATGEALNYEKFGVCTPDLLGVARRYTNQSVIQAAEEGLGLSHAMVLLFLAGFDLGYQARIEVESRAILQGDSGTPT